ncbi:ATP-binding cassette domain-containing protein [Streptomyces shenzhenensis]|uniref:ATP-binding cassette domain-containing protein n=1 Tax=Streptomyces shenzhenensis TaxID=943815 RepID=UPI0033C4E23B
MVRITDHGTPAVKGVRLEVPAGQVLCVSGPSGSGKSTLLCRINLLEAWDAGTAEVDGALVGYDRVAREADGTDACGSRTCFPHLTVPQNIGEAPVTVRTVRRAESAAQARGLLDEVGPADYEDACPRQLSGGRQQQVAIVRALVMRPGL